MSKTNQVPQNDKVPDGGEDKGMTMPLVSHLVELRQRLTYAVLALVGASLLAYPFAEYIYAVLTQPLLEASSYDASRRMIFTNLPEVFLTYIKLSFFVGGMMTFPFILWQVWLFIAPGLYEKEKTFVSSLLVATPILFFVGALFVYFFILPLAWGFFLSFEGTWHSMPIQLEAKVGEYLSITMKLLFAFGVAFELPVFLLLLARAGMVKSDMLRKGRKYAVILIFAVAALLTPPDIISQIALGVPMMGLYELSIFLIDRLNRSSKEVN